MCRNVLRKSSSSYLSLSELLNPNSSIFYEKIIMKFMTMTTSDASNLEEPSRMRISMSRE
ncbi:CLUMA_CG010536, isoform A [Clunio marinus]|uniref:CLUMA_CG010536, isoform A n=1 Tax=Clunio marinus TaxID=568069 RepID=A0A1J1IA95_9DIPT|nr:CLUMA_CG010536, isoform A [Clunio marinus]